MERQSFATTRWSLVMRAANPAAPHSRDALATLCQTYWYPLYAFIRRNGHPPDRAEDLTQEFFALLLEKSYLEDVGPGRGKFRSFLLVCVKRFLANEWDRQTALKRGGGKRLLSIDPADAEHRYSLEPAHDLTPDKIYQRRWAMTVLGRALDRVAQEFRASGKGDLFEALKGHLTGEPTGDGYADIAKRLKMSAGAARVAVHRMRARYRDALRDEIAGTLDDPADVEKEIAELLSALSVGGGGTA